MKTVPIGSKQSIARRLKGSSRKYFLENLDLMILILAAIFFTITSLTGADSNILDPVTVALLGVLAFSQIRSRTQISELTASSHLERTDLFLWDFPEEYKKSQKRAMKSYLFIGVTMARTLPLMINHIKRILGQNGRVRILLPDPNNQNLVEMIAATRPGTTAEQIRGKIQHSLDDLHYMHSNAGSLEVRVIAFPPNVGINAMDLESTNDSHRSIMVQMYEFAPSEDSERAPIFLLTTRDKVWFDHFAELSERLWEAGEEYRPIA